MPRAKAISVAAGMAQPAARVGVGSAAGQINGRRGRACRPTAVEAGQNALVPRWRASADEELSLDLEPHEQEEEGHEGVVHPIGECFAEHGQVLQLNVAAVQRAVGGCQCGGGGRDEGEAAEGFGSKKETERLTHGRIKAQLGAGGVALRQAVVQEGLWGGAVVQRVVRVIRR